ncbi:MAG: TPM domain-containing protein [Bacteroidetes bacterium]|nr:TPM domain-containing protein [Bacteroidota bacterium]
MANAKNFFTEDEITDIKQAIMDAEFDTSGEIRVHIENNCIGDAVNRATYVFDKLKMNKTELRNGVLFYLAVKARKFAIIGDQGINEKVPENFWNGVKQTMLNHFREDEFANGLCEGVVKAGEQLKEHFPHQHNDVNELPDDISFDEKL